LLPGESARLGKKKTPNNLETHICCPPQLEVLQVSRLELISLANAPRAKPMEFRLSQPTPSQPGGS
jgi:hypothetical protein